MKKTIKMFTILFLATCLILNTACSDKSTNQHRDNSSDPWDNSVKVLTPIASGSSILGNASIVIDTSNSSDGYLMVKYTGSATKVKFFITTPDSVKYTYDLTPSSEYSTLPLTGGDGNYSIDVMEHVMDNKYSSLYKNTCSVSLTNEFLPFLYPNQFTWFTTDSEAVKKAAELTSSSSDMLGAIEQIYTYVITNVKYDYGLAENVSASYLPNVDETLATGTGICFDYAALMTAMLRSQGIPTKLEIGYSGQAYHSWISTYSEETGWINNVIHFDGKSWSLMDPTLAASNGSSTVKTYVGDGSNYILKYSR